MSSPGGLSSSLSSICSSNASAASSTFQYSDSEDGLVNALNDGMDRLNKALEISLIERNSYMDEVSNFAADTADRVTKLQKKTRDLDEVVHKGRVENEKTRVDQRNALRRLHDYLEADPETKETFDETEKRTDKLMEKILKMHREYYHYDRLYDANDQMGRVRELEYEIEQMEETLKAKEQIHPEQIIINQAIKAVKVLMKGRVTLEDTGYDLIQRLHAFDIQKKA